MQPTFFRRTHIQFFILIEASITDSLAGLSEPKMRGSIRFMSRKGCSPGNSACEGFFVRMKNEMFQGRSWQGVALENFIQQIEAYMVCNRDERMKLPRGGLSPAEFRSEMGITI